MLQTIMMLLLGAMLGQGADIPGGESEGKARVIVVGTGLAGLSAALEAAQKGAEVTVVEMWSVFGGTSIMSGGKVAIVDTPLQRARGIEDSPELALSDFRRRSRDFDEEWVEYYVKNSRTEIYDWLTAAGVPFREVVQFGGNSVARAHGTGELGVGLVVPLFQACARMPGIRFVWNTKATDLTSDNGRVTGVRGIDLRTGEKRTFRAGAVILATGGFQSNLNLIREHWPKMLPAPGRVLTGSGVNSQGFGHAMAAALGSSFQRMDYVWNYPYGLPDPRYPGTDRGVMFAHGRSVWVNAEGKRFVNESAGEVEKLSAMLQQRTGSYWAIFDQRQKERVYVAGSFFANFAVVDRLIYGNPELVKKASTLEELAGISGLPGDALRTTVEKFNAMIDNGNDTEFQRFESGKNLPPKIEEPPFYAVHLYPLTRKNMGGVQTDHACRVLSRTGEIIPGLYAVGELSGFAAINGTRPLEGTFLGPCVVTGRVAARTAAMEAREQELPKTNEEARPEREVRPGASAAVSCIDCHALKTLTREHRPGYTHFEYAHRQVLERHLDCSNCHGALVSYDAARHRTDWVELSRSCRICHLPER